MASIFCEYPHMYYFHTLHLDKRSILSDTSTGSLPVVGRFIQPKSPASTASLSIAQMTKQYTNFHVDFLSIKACTSQSLTKCHQMFIVHPPDSLHCWLHLQHSYIVHCKINRVKMLHLQNPTCIGQHPEPGSLDPLKVTNFQTQFSFNIRSKNVVFEKWKVKREYHSVSYYFLSLFSTSWGEESSTWPPSTSAPCVSSLFHMPASWTRICWFTLEWSYTNVQNVANHSV